MNYHHPINNRLCEVWIISKSTWTLITFDLRLQPPIRVQSVRQGTLATQGCKNKLDTSRIGQIYQRQCQNHYRWRTDSLQICWVISGNVLCSNTCMAGYCAYLSHTLGAENRCFCHKNAQPKQTGPSSKIVASKTLILYICAIHYCSRRSKRLSDMEISQARSFIDIFITIAKMGIN